jgi:hypothetical protein
MRSRAGGGLMKFRLLNEPWRPTPLQPACFNARLGLALEDARHPTDRSYDGCITPLSLTRETGGHAGQTGCQVIENGQMYSPAVLDLTDDDMMASFGMGLKRIAALSMATGYPTIAAVPHMIINAYKNVLAVAVETDYSFKYADKVKAYLADPSAFASAAPAAASGGAAAAKAPEPEPEEEEEDMGFDLFD